MKKFISLILSFILFAPGALASEIDEFITKHPQNEKSIRAYMTLLSGHQSQGGDLAAYITGQDLAEKLLANGASEEEIEKLFQNMNEEKTTQEKSEKNITAQLVQKGQLILELLKVPDISVYKDKLTKLIYEEKDPKTQSKLTTLFAKFPLTSIRSLKDLTFVNVGLGLILLEQMEREKAPLGDMYVVNDLMLENLNSYLLMCISVTKLKPGAVINQSDVFHARNNLVKATETLSKLSNLDINLSKKNRDLLYQDWKDRFTNQKGFRRSVLWYSIKAYSNPRNNKLMWTGIAPLLILFSDKPHHVALSVFTAVLVSFFAAIPVALYYPFHRDVEYLENGLFQGKAGGKFIKCLSSLERLNP